MEWRKCSSCKKSIETGARYYLCNVSTCNNQRTGYVFCSVPCFEVHVPGARHKDAYAVEEKAPMQPSALPPHTLSNPATSPAGARRTIPSSTSVSPTFGSKNAAPKDILIIASRLKEYIQARSEFNTSANVMDVLSDYVRIICDRAIDNARAEGRKTVLDRDFDFLKKN